MDIFSAGSSDTVIEADYQLFTCSVDGWLESPESPRDIEASKGRKLRQGSISPLLAVFCLSGRSTFAPSQSLITPLSIDVGEHLNIESKCQERGAASNDDSPVHKSCTLHNRFKLFRTAALEALGVVDDQ